MAGVLLSLCCSTSTPDNVRFTQNSCCRFMLSFPIHFSRKLSTFDTIAGNLKFLATNTNVILSHYIYSAIIFQHHCDRGFFFLAWSRQGIILVLFSWHCKAHSNVHTRFFRSFHVFKFYGSAHLHLSTLVSNAI